MITSKGEAEAVARTAAQAARERAQWGGWSSPLGPLKFAIGIWGIVVGLVCYLAITPRLLLIARYGWARVQRDGLSIVDKHGDAFGWTFVISNGERIRAGEHLLDLITLVPLVAIMAVTAPLIWLAWRLWPRGAGSPTRRTSARGST